MYYKTIDVVVVENNTSYSGGRFPHYYQEVTIKSGEYGLQQTFDYEDSGVFADMDYWYYKEGDVVKATLYS